MSAETTAILSGAPKNNENKNRTNENDCVAVAGLISPVLSKLGKARVELELNQGASPPSRFEKEINSPPDNCKCLDRNLCTCFLKQPPAPYNHPASEKSSHQTASEGNCKTDELKVLVPGENDVIHGKGYSILKRPGNKYYRSLIVSIIEDYDAAPKSLKGIFAHQIVNHIYNLTPPGRFLRKDLDSEAYFLVGKEEAVRKARQALRDRKALNNKSKALALKKMALQKAAKIGPLGGGDLPLNEEVIHLRDENSKLKRKLASMQREMYEMIAVNKLVQIRVDDKERDPSIDAESSKKQARTAVSD